MKHKRGELATSTLIIIIATLILISGFLYGYFNQLDSLVSDSYQNSRFVESSLTKGFDIIEIEASDGRNNGFDSFYVTVRLLPDSDEIDFTQTNVLVRSRNWSAGLVYRPGVPVQNSSGFVGYTNETGYYQATHLITSQFHKSGHIVRGEVVKLFIHVPYVVPDNEEVGFNIVSPSGISYPITVFTGNTIPAMDRVKLFPQV